MKRIFRCIPNCRWLVRTPAKAGSRGRCPHRPQPQNGNDNLKCTRIFIYIISLIIAGSCKEKFIPNLQSPATGYLVVEGFINSGQEPTTITLTRTTKLYDSADIIYEHNATVNILGENNETFPLFEIGNGKYVSSTLNLNDNEKYRLQIKTSDNKEYLSDFTAVKHTPDIDSITYVRNNDGLKIYVNTHDASNNTKYYKWDYEETWEFHSAYLSSLTYIRDPFTNKIIFVDYKDPVTRLPDTSIYKCWHSSNATSIIIGSSEKLTADVIHLPLLSIEPASEKLSVLYSINVKQYALSNDAYLFFEKIKKNTEQLGSIFDAQPSELQGNIHCTTDPSEIVVGYVDVSEQKDKRIFISNAELPGWNYQTGCQTTIIFNQGDSITKYGQGLLPIKPHKVGIGIIDFFASGATCVDCTLIGTNIKPSFWP
jgi:hypothetical protein